MATAEVATEGVENGSDVRELQIIFPTDIQLVPVAEAMLTQVTRDLGYDDETIELIGVAVIEAIMNAIKHGNKYDLSKKVYMTLRFDSEELMIRVKDEGEGFNPEEVANPLEGDNLFRDHGRGLLMIRAYMDDAYHNEDGTELTLIKKLPK